MSKRPPDRRLGDDEDREQDEGRAHRRDHEERGLPPERDEQPAHQRQAERPADAHRGAQERERGSEGAWGEALAHDGGADGDQRHAEPLHPPTDQEDREQRRGDGDDGAHHGEADGDDQHALLAVHVGHARDDRHAHASGQQGEGDQPRDVVARRAENLGEVREEGDDEGLLDRHEQAAEQQHGEHRPARARLRFGHLRSRCIAEQAGRGISDSGRRRLRRAWFRRYRENRSVPTMLRPVFAPTRSTRKAVQGSASRAARPSRHTRGTLDMLAE
ncbi:MAG: hypothetical protein R2732_00070 [Microbacteriaceae bacterium]